MHFFLLFVTLRWGYNSGKKSRCRDLYLLFLYNSQHKVWNIGQFLLERNCWFVTKQGIMRSRNTACIEKVGQNIYQIILYVTSHCESYHISHLLFWRQSSHVWVLSLKSFPNMTRLSYIRIKEKDKKGQEQNYPNFSLFRSIVSLWIFPLVCFNWAHLTKN